MQERKEQERAGREQEDDPFQLWAASLSDALEDTTGPEGVVSIAGKVGHGNGGSSKVAKTAIALAAAEGCQPRDIEAEEDWLGATRRRVRLENERLLLKQEAMRHALEELGQLHSAVEARHTETNGGAHHSEVLDETAIWLYAENEAAHRTNEAIQTARRHDEPASTPVGEANQQIQRRSSQPTPRVPDSNDVKIPPSGTKIRMLLPHPQHQVASVGRATLFLDKCVERIIRYRRLLSQRLT